MFHRVALGCLVAAAMVQLAEASPRLVAVRVDAVVIRPITARGYQWDGVGKGVPGVVAEAVRDEVESWVKDAVKELASTVALPPVAARLAVEALKWLNDANAAPDPFGAVTVNGRVVATLPMVQNTVTPTWPAVVGGYVAVTKGTKLVVQLLDSDIAGQHDPIGTCTFRVPDVARRAPVTLKSQSCTDELLGASVVITELAPPVAMRLGTYRLALVRAGISAKTPAGVPWDVSGEADPRIRIEVDGQTILCPVTRGQHTSICAPSGPPIAITAKTKIRFLVTEVDALVDDAVGDATGSAFLDWNAGQPIPLAVTGSVEWADLVFEPISAP